MKSRAEYFHERDTLTPCEEWTVVAGLLMRLNAINYSVTMKGEDLNKSVSMQSFTDSVQQFLNSAQYMYIKPCIIFSCGKVAYT